MSAADTTSSSLDANELASLRTQAALDRTLLAWIRTAFALQGFGFTLATYVTRWIASGYTLGAEFIRTGEGKYKESTGKAKLYVDDKVVAEGPMRTQTGKFTLCGDGLCVGRDSGDAVSSEYRAPARFKGGKIQFVAVSIEKEQYLPLERIAAAAFATD